MTLMWRHRNRPGVPDRDVELGGPPLEGKTVNYPPKSDGSDPTEASTPPKSWSKEHIQEWAAENGFELDPNGTKAQWLEAIAAKVSETPSGAGETGSGQTAPEGTDQESGDITNEVNPEGVTPNGEGNAQE